MLPRMLGRTAWVVTYLRLEVSGDSRLVHCKEGNETVISFFHCLVLSSNSCAKHSIPPFASYAFYFKEASCPCDTLTSLCSFTR